MEINGGNLWLIWLVNRQTCESDQDTLGEGGGVEGGVEGWEDGVR